MKVFLWNLRLWSVIFALVAVPVAIVAATFLIPTFIVGAVGLPWGPLWGGLAFVIAMPVGGASLATYMEWLKR